MANKISWKCVITGCTSPAKAPGHYFPKNKELMKKWLKAISMPWMSNLSENEIQKCRICHLHFSENAYIFTLNRRRLKHNAIPTENLSTGTTEIHDTSQLSMSEVQEKNTTFKINMQCNESIERIGNDISQPSTSQVHEKDSVLETNINIDMLENKTQQEARQCDSKIDNIIRKDHLTPIAKKLYIKSRTFQKQNNILRRKLVYYKHRLKYATRFSSLTFFTKYSTLTNTQRMFIEMQIKNLNKKSKVLLFVRRLNQH